MATILLDLSPGDEVVMPSFTFTSAATALINFGVVPVFVDIQTLDLNINVS
jgi:dTDP-4-amino-4,6-dideoxygalactose transaminase